ncbi:MAG: hypothetical protein ABI605_19695 [Rhizobacter sp.]
MDSAIMSLLGAFVLSIIGLFVFVWSLRQGLLVENPVASSVIFAPGEISVAGQTYNGAMPAFGQLGDAELSAVLSHVRGTWSNKSAAIKADLITAERKASDRTTPFAGGEQLKALAAKAP